MDEKDKNDNLPEESNAARRIRMLGENTPPPEEEEPLKINRPANFWYHHKWKVVITAFFVVVLGVAAAQFAGQQNPDVQILYGGPLYITPNENQAFCGAAESLCPDYNGDGKIYVQLNDMVFFTENQLNERIAAAEESGEEVGYDRLSNAQMQERFTYEVFGGEASICILAEEQYREVCTEGGFLPLAEIFGEDDLPEGRIDDYGVRLSETKFWKFYGTQEMFPEDTVIALRRVSTMSALTGKSRAEKLHANSLDFFRRLLAFEYPEGYVEE
ncbi:MAG: hypothetical protein ACI4V1_05415 [Eubacteriales bacterium]